MNIPEGTRLSSDPSGVQWRYKLSGLAEAFATGSVTAEDFEKCDCDVMDTHQVLKDGTTPAEWLQDSSNSKAKLNTFDLAPQILGWNPSLSEPTGAERSFARVEKVRCPAAPQLGQPLSAAEEAANSFWNARATTTCTPDGRSDCLRKE